MDYSNNYGTMTQNYGLYHYYADVNEKKTLHKSQRHCLAWVLSFSLSEVRRLRPLVKQWWSAARALNSSFSNPNVSQAAQNWELKWWWWASDVTIWSQKRLSQSLDDNCRTEVHLPGGCLLAPLAYDNLTLRLFLRVCKYSSVPYLLFMSPQERGVSWAAALRA